MNKKGLLKRLMSVTLVVAICMSTLIGGTTLKSKAADVSNSEWMNSLWYEIKNKTLLEITMPVSHDSGTYKLDKNLFDLSQVASGIDSTLSTIVNGIPGPLGGDLVRQIIYNTSRTNSANIYDQLALGYRSLDLRFKRSNVDHKIHIFHGLFGPGPEEIFYQIKDFVKDHPSEIIIVNLNNGGYLDDFDNGGKQELAQRMVNILGNYMIDRNTFNTKMTLQQIRDTGKNLIVVSPDQTIRNTSTKFLYNIGSVSGTWPNTENFETMKNRVYDHYNKNFKWASNPSDFRYDLCTLMNFNGDETVKQIEDSAKKLPIPIYGQIQFIDTLTKLAGKSLQGFVESSRGQYRQLLLDLGSENGANVPNIYNRDFLSPSEANIIIAKNFGNNRANIEKRRDQLKTLFDQTGNPEVQKAYGKANALLDNYR